MTITVTPLFPIPVADVTGALSSVNDLSDVYSAVASLANIGGEPFNWDINNQTSNYVLIPSDFTGTLITYANSSAATFTLPQTTTDFVSVGSRTRVYNYGPGIVTFAVQGIDTITGNLILLPNEIAEIEKILESGIQNNWNVAGGSSTQTYIFTGFISIAANQVYNLALNMPFGGTITATSTECLSGTCTATFDISGTSLGGTANAVSSSRQTQAQASSNVFAAGNDIHLTISSNSVCLSMCWTITYTRTF